MRCLTEYHSPEWMILVESGWTTWTVDELSDGTRVAVMVRR